MNDLNLKKGDFFFEEAPRGEGNFNEAKGVKWEGSGVPCALRYSQQEKTGCLELKVEQFSKDCETGTPKYLGGLTSGSSKQMRSACGLCPRG